MKIKLDNKFVGEDYPTFIIAEAGVNHNGNIKLAKKLIDTAEYAGVDAVKFQTFNSKNLVTSETDTLEYQEKNIGKKESHLKMLQKLELDYSCFPELKKYCDKKGIIFLSTPHTEDAISVLDPLVSAYKIGSGDLNNIPYLKKIVTKNKPMIISTGMSYLKEIINTYRNLKKDRDVPLIFLHCTTNYPCPRNQVNLKAMSTLKNELNCIIGYSDHTKGIDVPIMAVKLGAKVIEKHFTLDRKLPGPDHAASLEPEELKEMVDRIRDLEGSNYDVKLDKEVLGSSIKEPNEDEKKILQIARKSIIANKNIAAGEKITEDTLIIKRPGTGLKPKKINDVIGKHALKDIKKDTLIRLEDLK